MQRNAFDSIYDSPDVQRRLELMRLELRQQGIPPYPIGRAYIPGSEPPQPEDQAWLRSILR